MPVTRTEIDSFHRFATDMLDAEAVESLEEVLRMWRAEQDRAHVNAAIREGLAEIDAGLGRPLDEFVRDCRTKYDIEPGT